nr:unnamed protein product [Spirometra erinaceieuropaei]
MSNDSTSQPIAGIHTFDLPSVWLDDIALWLRTVEFRFAHRQITREDTKFHYVVAALPMDIATDLRDIIDCPPTEAPYTALKEALISRISLSTQKHLQCLISEEDFGDRKPTQLLRRLEQLADGQKLDATMFKQPFLQRLPPSVQAIPAPNIPSSTVQMLAETADHMLEYYQPHVTVGAANRSKTAPTVEDIVKRLDALTLEVSQLRATRVYNPRSPAISRRQRSPTPNQPTVDGFCWYHHNYGSNAHRCHSPYSVRRPLQQPYDGPFRLLSRKDKHFTIDRGGRTDVVSLIEHLMALFQETWHLEKDFKDATTVHLYKRKGNRQLCDNHHCISLLNIAWKVFARILLNRLNNLMEEGLLSESQCGFRRHRGTTDMIFVARQLQEKCQEMMTQMYSTFVDLTKALDTVNPEGLLKTM